MTPGTPQRRTELRVIDRERSRIVLTSVLALIVLAVALFRAPPTAVVVVTLLVLVALKKALIRYRALEERKADLRDDGSSLGPPER